ncbi:hypothetical protein [Heyndrickxia camelliae]|nr:hypothetical protein [Heyndrickxia camelliae]
MDINKVILLLDVLKVANLDVDYEFREAVKHEIANELGLLANNKASE